MLSKRDDQTLASLAKIACTSIDDAMLFINFVEFDNKDEYEAALLGLKNKLKGSGGNFMKWVNWYKPITNK